MLVLVLSDQRTKYNNCIFNGGILEPNYSGYDENTSVTMSTYQSI